MVGDSPPNEYKESGTQTSKNNQLHPFGLFWSELDGTNPRNDQNSSTAMSGIAQNHVNIMSGRGAPLNSVADSSNGPNTLPDMFRKNVLSDRILYEDAMDTHQLSHMDQDRNQFELAEKLLSQQYQKQRLQQHNLLSSHGHLNESMLERIPNRNMMPHQQQLASQTGQDLEQLMVLQLQHQRQLQLQQQHQLQQQQQFQQQELLLKEQQQSQARQMLLEQLLQNQMHDPLRGQSHVDAGRSNNALDSIWLKQQILGELQQHPQLRRHADPSIEDLIQAKFGQVAHQGHQSDLMEHISHLKHGQMQPLENHIMQQEQLRARQFPMDLRQRMEIEDRQHGSPWPIDESNQFHRNPAAPYHRSNSVGFGHLEFHQQQQRMSPDEHLSHFERSLSLQDRIQRGLYDPRLPPFERSMLSPAAGGGPGMNLDMVSSIARGQALELPESNVRMHHTGQVAGFSSGMYSHHSIHPSVANQFHPSHLDAIEGQWPESNSQLSNDWMESRIQQMQISERQKREAEARRASDSSSLWMSAGTSDDTSKRLLMELLHQKSGHQSTEPLDVGRISYDRRPPSGHYSGTSPTHSFDQELGQNQSTVVGSYGSNSGGLSQVRVAEEVIGPESTDRLPLRSSSGAISDRGPLLSGVNETSQGMYSHSVMTGTPSTDFLEVEGRRHGFRSEDGMTKGPASETREVKEGLGAVNLGEMPANVASRHISLGDGGNYQLLECFYNMVRHIIIFLTWFQVGLLAFLMIKLDRRTLLAKMCLKTGKYNLLT